MFSRIQISIKSFPRNCTQVKNYGRWTHRRPVKILPPEEHSDSSAIETHANQNENSVETSKTSNIQWRHAPIEETLNDKPKIKRTPFKINTKKDSSYDMLQTVIDSNGEFIYTKLPNKDARVTSVLTNIQSNNGKEQKSILLEGKRLIQEALANNCRLEYLLFSRKSDIEQIKSLLPKSNATLYKMPYREIQLWSSLTTSPGIMGIFKKPDLENVDPPPDSIPVTIICDNIREPGNLGTVLRTCAGAGCQKIILTKGCVNLWDTKVTRSATGAHFRLNISTKIDWQDVETLIQSGSRILMADNKLVSSSNENIEDTTFRIENVPLIPYYGIDVDKTVSITLIIGGETEGLSEDAYKFIYERQGVRLNIPLMSGIDSLNSGVALGILLFEIKKQMLLNIKDNYGRIENVG